MNNRKIIIGGLAVLILLFAFFTIKNIRDNRARNSEIDFLQQMKVQQTELTQKLQLLEDSLQQLQYINNRNIANSLRQKQLELEIKRLEVLSKKSKSTPKNSKTNDKELLRLKKQIEELTKKQNAPSQSSQDREEIVRLKKQLAEVSARSKSKTNTSNVDQGDYAMQIELLKKQLIECKKNAGSNTSDNKSNNNIVVDVAKEEAYKKQIADLQQQLSQYTEALSNRTQESSDNIKMLAQNIEATGLYVDKKTNAEKSTMFVAKMQTFKVSFTITSVKPMEGEIAFVVRIYNLATNEVLKIPGVPYVEIFKEGGEGLTCSYAQAVVAKSQKKINVQKVFDAYSEFQKLTKNAIFMIEIYTRSGLLLGTQKIKLMTGQTVTTF